MNAIKLILLVICLFTASRSFAVGVEVNDAVSFELGGKLHVDVGNVDDGTTRQTDAQLRRLRLGISGKWGKHVRTELEYDLAGNTGLSSTVKNAYIEYRGIPYTQVRVGNMKSAAGFENTTSSNNTLFMERALLSALLPGYATGIQVSQNRDRWSVAAGFAGGTPTTLSDMGNVWDEQELLYARATGLLVNKKSNVLHIGGSLSRTDPHQHATRFSARPETIFASKLLDTGNIRRATQYTTQGVDVAWVNGSLLLQGEYVRTAVERAAREDVNLSGWYVAAAYVVTGEARAYKKSDAQFESISPKQNWGALELVARVSQLDLQSVNISGGKMLGHSVGANYYYNDNVRLMLDYSRMEASPNKSGKPETNNILQARVQVSF